LKNRGFSGYQVSPCISLTSEPMQKGFQRTCWSPFFHS